MDDVSCETALRVRSQMVVVRPSMFVCRYLRKTTLFARITLFAQCADNVILANNDFLLTK